MNLLKKMKPMILPALIIFVAVIMAVVNYSHPVRAGGGYYVSLDAVYMSDQWYQPPYSWGNCGSIQCSGPGDVGNWCSADNLSPTTYCYMGDTSNCGNDETDIYSCKGPACTPDSSCAASTCTSSSCSDACGNVYAGTKSCPVCVPQMGTLCSSPTNACGASGSGTIDCFGACSASIPPLPGGYGGACSSAANACGATNSGTIDCSGSCTAGGPPPLPGGYGGACSSVANACGATNPGTIDCSGSCSASAPPLPGGYGNPCFSASNMCGMKNAGTIDCSGSCNAVKPLDSLCSAPDLSAGAVTPITATAGSPTSYSATITNPGSASTGTTYTNIFEFDSDNNHTVVDSIQTVTAGPTPGGGTTNITKSYTFASAGTGYVRGCVDNDASFVGTITESDETNNCGAWTPITVMPSGGYSITSCTPSPAVAAIGANVTWTVTSVGFVPAPTYTWLASGGTPSSGTGGATTFTTNYATAGAYSAAVSATNGTQSAPPHPCTPVTVSGGVCVDTGPVTITASATRVQSGTKVNISWNGSNVSAACTVSGPGISTTATPSSCTISGSAMSPVLTTQATYKLVCPGGQTSQVVVNVIPKIQEI